MRVKPAMSRDVEAKWQRVWVERGTFRAQDDGRATRRYLLTMFPYPSGDLHMGHAEVFALEDVVARYWRLRGYDVMNPIGWDSFGLPAENAAIRRGENPAVFTEENIADQARSIRRYGVSFDWSRRLETHRPEYYRWTQWLFLRLRERGLAYRAAGAVNWCPRDQTVLANEQVVAGRCERCGAQVSRRDLTQWFFRVTAYADRLLDDMTQLEGGWPERVLTMQRNWIGRREGVRVRFDVLSTGGTCAGEVVEVFTTRPDTLPAATFLVVAPESGLAATLCAADRADELLRYRDRAAAAGDIARSAVNREKTGVFLGTWVAHPVTGERLPVWAADYVLPRSGTGAVMGVPACDERDAAFARAHGLRETPPGERWPTAAQAIAWLEATGHGEPATSYRLRDWLVSRQRYWGVPIPIVHCPRCGEVAVPDDELPVRLPDLCGSELLPRGVAPLAAARSWVEVPCPACGGPAERDTDTMDTFVDSSWYFLRYCSPDATDVPFRPEDARRWMPAAQYVGGAEHAILHLLYSRFVTKVLHDLGMVDVVEPFATLLNQGHVINGGRAMSKSLGNGVKLGEQLDRYGADAVRLAMVFAGPPEDDIDWADLSPAAMQRFLARALRLADEVGPATSLPAPSSPPSAPAGGDDLRRTVHRTVRDIEGLLAADRFNVVVARVMELLNVTRRTLATGLGAREAAVREAVETFAVLLSLFAPYTAEEMWERLGHEPSVSDAAWPVVDASLLTDETVEAVVQVQGRLRDRFTVATTVTADELRQLALERPAVQRALAGRAIAKTVVRPPRLVNIVLR
ncbi:leucine--tRNA ligase [Frankia sp. QA3]|uniref:leucine--tRNA ligase n=1 Tax=Frankia sp. QA3 TaxID=710111 RepID=UPI000269C644|nr:leucine--tRNA ligase [Frankia sp. QA3]EIV94948.1 leucyl-tRNA synthetase [Frankia sp. QA3]